MNLRRIITGPLLSVLFLALFVYVIAGLQWVLDDSSQNQNNQEYSADISGGVQSVATNEIPNGFEYCKF